MMRRFQEEADFPGREIAATITQRWHETVGTPLAYLVGKLGLSPFALAEDNFTPLCQSERTQVS